MDSLSSRICLSLKIGPVQSASQSLHDHLGRLLSSLNQNSRLVRMCDCRSSTFSLVLSRCEGRTNFGTGPVLIIWKMCLIPLGFSIISIDRRKPGESGSPGMRSRYSKNIAAVAAATGVATDVPDMVWLFPARPVAGMFSPTNLYGAQSVVCSC